MGCIIADVGEVSDGSSRSNFFGLGHLIISSAEFLLPRSLPACSFIPSVCHFCVQLSPPHPASLYLLLPARPPGRVLVSVVPRNGWSTLEEPLRGTCCYLTEAPVILHCHAFAFANFWVCLVWQLEPVAAAGVVSKILKAFRLVVFGKSRLIKSNMKGKYFL